MKAPWPHDRCILCLDVLPLTEEHLIPECLGGRLVADLLCKPCNDRMGHSIEARARSAPEIQLAIHAFANAHPEHGKPLAEGLRVLAEGESGTLRARIRDGDLSLSAQRLADGSIIIPEEIAPEHVRRLLSKRGADEAAVEQAIEVLRTTPLGEVVTLAPGVEVATFQTADVVADLSGAVADPLIPVKIAFEWIALHLGEAIYGTGLDPIRRALRDATMDPEAVSVESLRAGREDALHGLLLEPNAPHARVQVRLFGSIAYRVHFRRIGVLGQRCVYTLRLASGEEAVAIAEGEQPASPGREPT